MSQFLLQDAQDMDEIDDPGFIVTPPPPPQHNVGNDAANNDSSDHMDQQVLDFLQSDSDNDDDDDEEDKSEKTDIDVINDIRNVHNEANQRNLAPNWDAVDANHNSLVQNSTQTHDQHSKEPQNKKLKTYQEHYHVDLWDEDNWDDYDANPYTDWVDSDFNMHNLRDAISKDEPKHKHVKFAYFKFVLFVFGFFFF